jgi:hypothetical protein
MDPDIAGQDFLALFCQDAEGNVSRALVMFKAQWCQRYRSLDRSPSCQRLACVRGVSSALYRLGSTTLVLTSVWTSSMAYTQPFSNDSLVNTKSFCEDSCELPVVVVGWQNLSGILVVLLECVDEATCQCCGLCTTEVESCHTTGRNRSLQWELRLGRGEVKHGIGDNGGMPMEIFSLLATLSALSEIIVGG